MKYQIRETKHDWSEPFEGSTDIHSAGGMMVWGVFLTFEEDFEGLNASYKKGDTIRLNPNDLRRAK